MNDGCFIMADGRHAWWHDCRHTKVPFNFDDWFQSLVWDMQYRSQRRVDDQRFRNDGRYYR